MITAVDTNVLLDVFGGDPKYGPGSAAALRSSLSDGRLILCDVVWAETCAAFPDRADATRALSALGGVFQPLDEPAAVLAGTRWRRYRAAGGPRVRVVADFMIAAHAVVHADRLLTRDRGFFRTYFAELTVLDPTEP